MKLSALFSLVLALGLAHSALASDSSEIKRKTQLLSKIAYGAETHKVRGENAEDMMIKLYAKNTGETLAEARRTFIRNLPAKDIAFGDMTAWGSMRLPAAKSLFASQDMRKNKDGDDIDNSKGLELGDELLKELNQLGAKFGFTSGSSSYCGMSFMGLLVVDEEAETIYEIALTDGGSC